MAAGKSRGAAAVKRPLSPHLQIYAPSSSMVMSILHRLTGAALYVGTLLLVCWLVAAATGPEAFAEVSAHFNSLPGRIVLFGYTWALFQHMIGGVRHFIWDTGAGHELKSITLLSWSTLALSVLLTFLVWVSVWSAGTGVVAP
ncbi:MAG: succinate dehydrogenase, cytochrome b556 subunit [Hyphomicrobium sp.]